MQRISTVSAVPSIETERLIFRGHRLEDLEGCWVLARWAHGRGLATEAVRAAVAWGDVHFGTGRTVCLISPDNVASIRVANKCGYQEFARTSYKGQPTIMFERPRR